MPLKLCLDSVGDFHLWCCGMHQLYKLTLFFPTPVRDASMSQFTLHNSVRFPHWFRLQSSIYCFPRNIKLIAMSEMLMEARNTYKLARLFLSSSLRCWTVDARESKWRLVLPVSQTPSASHAAHAHIRRACFTSLRATHKRTSLYSSTATGQRSFLFRAVKLWSNLPEHLKCIDTLHNFKTSLRNILYDEFYNDC